MHAQNEYSLNLLSQAAPILGSNPSAVSILHPVTDPASTPSLSSDSFAVLEMPTAAVARGIELTMLATGSDGDDIAYTVRHCVQLVDKMGKVIGIESRVFAYGVATLGAETFRPSDHGYADTTRYQVCKEITLQLATGATSPPGIGGALNDAAGGVGEPQIFNSADGLGSWAIIGDLFDPTHVILHSTDALEDTKINWLARRRK